MVRSFHILRRINFFDLLDLICLIHFALQVFPIRLRELKTFFHMFDRCHDECTHDMSDIEKTAKSLMVGRKTSIQAIISHVLFDNN